MMRLSKRHRLLWGLTYFVILVGGAACLLTGRTLAHGLTIAVAAIYLSGAVYLADVYAPSEQGRFVRLTTGVISLGTFFALLAFYAWQMYTAQYVYVFDNSQYYYQQLVLGRNLPYGLDQVLALLGRTISGNDYTYVLNLLIEPLFAWTDRTIQSFTLCATVMTWMPLLYQLRCMLLCFAERLHFNAWQTVLLHAGMCLSLCVFPLIHAAAARGQINLLAMVFYLEIVQLSWGDDTWGCSLRRTDWQRRIALFLAVVMLVISRRWYIFLLGGYLLIWTFATLGRLIRRRAWRGLLHFAIYGAVCIALGLMLLSSFFRYALQGNYTTAYSYWNLGGLPYELWNQLGYVGGFCLMAIAAGYGWGLAQKRWKALRSLTGGMLLSAGLAMLFFTRIQNMYHHQSIILLPGYMFGLLLAFAALLSISRRTLRRITAGALSLALAGQYVLCLTNDVPVPLSPVISNISLKPPYRPDMEQVEALADFIDANCDREHKAFFLCDNGWYNRTTYTNHRYPDLQSRDKVVIEHYAFASHGFPDGWFTAAYYVVPDTCKSDRPEGTLEKLRLFLLEAFPDRFETVQIIDFGAFDMYIMRRKGPVRADEVDALLALFAQENAQYPQLFSNRIERYRAPDE